MVVDARLRASIYNIKKYDQFSPKTVKFQQEADRENTEKMNYDITSSNIIQSLIKKETEPL